jgi:hypothetical protein
MKQTSYKFGGCYIKAQFKPVGQGYETCVTFDKKIVFVGNFIHKKEATQWWAFMTREIRTFTKTYWLANKGAKTWYGKFFSNHLYKTYYKFLDKVFVKYNKTYKTAFSKDARKYNKVRRNWNREDRFQLVRSA